MKTLEHPFFSLFCGAVKDFKTFLSGICNTLYLFFSI